ncbi:MAG: WYL domain-containing protein [Ilumatobacter sp.]|nr:WYL domain-containing protein [Ilumatobacter sp.]
MRADRLVAVLLLLQQRGLVTVDDVAAELEISPRTARRDLEALGMAGLPVYATRGRGGGWRLAGGGRTDLSGLSSAEARALFLVAGPSAGATPELRAALRKLVRALPEPMRDAAERARDSVVVDPRGWGAPTGGDRPPPPHLDTVQQAVIDRVQLEMAYTARSGEATVRTVNPLGVAAKGAVWYLVAGTEAGLRTFRVDRIRSATPTGRVAERPDGFDLSEAWALITDRVEELRTPLVAHLAVQHDAARFVAWRLGPRVRTAAPEGDGPVLMEVRAHQIRELAGLLAGFGGAVEVLDPPELRAELGRVGGELVARYGASTAARPRGPAPGGSGGRARRSSPAAPSRPRLPPG